MAKLKNRERAKKHPWDYFNFGMSVERHLNETAKPGENRLRKSLGILIDVARGDLTLNDTPEEYAKNLPEDLKFLQDDLPKVLQEIRESERQVAKELLSHLCVDIP
jgi:hypothetical protein